MSEISAVYQSAASSLGTWVAVCVGVAVLGFLIAALVGLMAFVRRLYETKSNDPEEIYAILGEPEGEK